ncbi:MAG: response regulator [bacterium]
MAEIKYDIRRGADIYRTIDGSRLKGWISTGKIKRGEVIVWRSGLSGWRRPEEIEELVPFFQHWERLQLQEIKREQRKKRSLPQKKRIKEILIIDDEKDLCSLLSDILSPKGYNVAIAHTKREAIAYLKRNPLDLVFLDLKLPDAEGLKLLSKIRKINPEMIVNIITAYGTEEIREEAKNKGAYAFIDKPFTEDNILKSIR